MAKRPSLTKQQIEAAFQKKLIQFSNAIIRSLSYLGEMCVNHARSVNTYRDQTGNLRNSIGYVIVHNGTVIKSNFRASASVKTTSAKGKAKTTTGDQNGVVSGAELAAELASDVKGWGLIVVAGMNYAAAVESRGLDVLTSAEQMANTEWPRMKAELQRDISRKR